MVVFCGEMVHDLKALLLQLHQSIGGSARAVERLPVVWGLYLGNLRAGASTSLVVLVTCTHEQEVPTSFCNTSEYSCDLLSMQPT